jgi:hypothetical protein
MKKGLVAGLWLLERQQQPAEVTSAVVVGAGGR